MQREILVASPFFVSLIPKQYSVRDGFLRESPVYPVRPYGRPGLHSLAIQQVTLQFVGFLSEIRPLVNRRWVASSGFGEAQSRGMPCVSNFR